MLRLGQAETFLDQLGAVSYANTNGTRDWSTTPWTETDSLGGGATTGLALVTGGVLRLGLAETFLDQFGSPSYSLTNGTRDWSATPWTEPTASAAAPPPAWSRSPAASCASS